jgi:uncharacterized membrane protein YeaQ/YmgE (transglycosylase-associated protein family)
MSIFWGLVAGLIASHIVDRLGGGMILDVLRGIVGAVVGGWVDLFAGVLLFADF